GGTIVHHNNFLVRHGRGTHRLHHLRNCVAFIVTRNDDGNLHQLRMRNSESGIRKQFFRFPPSPFHFISNHVRECALHAFKDVQSADQEREDDDERKQKRQSRRGTFAKERPAETANHSYHWIQRIQRVPRRGDHALRIHDGRSKKPQLHEKGNQVTDVAILYIQRAEPQTDAERGRNGEQDQERQQQPRERGEIAIERQQRREQTKHNPEIHQPAEYAGYGNDEAREIDFGNQNRAAHQTLSAASDGAREIIPRQESRERKDRVRQIVRREFGEIAKDERKDNRRRQRLQRDPRDAEYRLLVAHLDIAPHQKIQQLAIFPHIVQMQRRPPARGTNADVGRDFGIRSWEFGNLLRLRKFSL